MSKLIKDLGAVSAYAYAVEKGYTGTEDEFAELMYDYADVAQTAVEAKDEAVSASTSAQASATIANTKAAEASASASNAQSASNSAQGAETNAETFALNAGTKATEAKQFADKAELNAQKTQSDKEAVESAKSDVLSAVDSAQNYANSAQSASQAIQNMSVEATTLEPDSDATVAKTVDAISGAVTLTYGIPKGQVGEKGDKGNTGDSGVYIGTSAPSDENVKVWIDSDGEPDIADIQIDPTLTQSGQAADAKVVGNEIKDLNGVDVANSELAHNVLSLASTFQTIPVWEQGGIDSSNGELTDNTNACRSLPIGIVQGCDITIRLGSIGTYSFRPIWYDSNIHFLSSGGRRSTNHKYVTGTEIPTNVAYLRIAVYRQDSADFLPTEDTFISNVEHNANPLSPINDIATLNETIVEHETRIDSIETAIASSNVPDYFQSQLEEKIPQIIENMNACGKDGETFVFITDTHWETNYQKSPLLIDYIFKNTKVNHILHGGDVINEGEKSVMYKTMIAGIRAFQFGHADYFLPIARGNHDDNSNWSAEEDITTHEFDYNTVFSLMFKDIANKVTFLTTNEYSFYYDSPSSKTRFIFVDTRRNGKYITYDNLITLINETPDGYKLIFVAHYIYNKTVFVQGARGLFAMIAAFNSKTSGEYLGQTFDFTNSKGKAVCVLAGHTHEDFSWDKDDASNTAGVPIIITDTDSWRNNSAVEGTVTSQCFDVVTVDYVNSIVKCVRIGRGNDRTFTFN